ncbi:MAG TPA: hypothetical protein VGZ93_09930 [Candidatus Methylacidiphilales bacterium]|jgi:hypothetical protein|nr:hypothetical protein [Candidatus Methylacidiphilales bacterium]
MSATIYWRPVAKRMSYIDTDAPSSFIEALREAFGRDLPAKFAGEDIPVLKGMAAADRGQRKAYEGMIKAIEEFGIVELWAEY